MGASHACVQHVHGGGWGCCCRSGLVQAHPATPPAHQHANWGLGPTWACQLSGAGVACECVPWPTTWGGWGAGILGTHHQSWPEGVWRGSERLLPWQQPLNGSTWRARTWQLVLRRRARAGEGVWRGWWRGEGAWPVMHTLPPSTGCCAPLHPQPPQPADRYPRRRGTPADATSVSGLFCRRQPTQAAPESESVHVCK